MTASPSPGASTRAKRPKYLCSLRYSSKTDIAVVSLSPAGGDAAQQEFRQLFDYFHSKNRYGVVGSKTLAQRARHLPYPRRAWL